MKMKIFIGWSGPRSHALAKALRFWLPKVIHMLDPFISSEDIKPADRWSSSLARELQSAKFGIVCVTKSNLLAPWLHFETGVLSVPYEQGRVCPILFDVAEKDLPDTLSQYQSIRPTKDKMYELMSAFNDALEEDCLRESELKDSFKQWWPRLDSDIKKILTDQSSQYVDFSTVANQFLGYLNQTTRITHTVFHELLMERITQFEARCKEWSAGTIEADPQTYKSTLVDIYRSAKKNVFSTSIDKYLDNWFTELGSSILDAHREAIRRNPDHVIERVFVFNKSSDVSLRAIEAMDIQQAAGVSVRVFYNEDPGLGFDSRLFKDFTIIDDGDVIGVTQEYGVNKTRALWYFNDKAFWLELQRFKRNMVYECKNYDSKLRNELINKKTESRDV